MDANKRCPRTSPAFGDVMLVPGIGPVGNPMRVRVRSVEDGKVKFSTAMGDGELSLSDWISDMDDPDVKILSRATGT